MPCLARPRYEVNFEPQSGILNDLYQGYVRTPPGRWSTVTLPLNRLLLTGQGQIRDVQRKWDNGMELKSVGFTIADGIGGPFQLDVAWVSLVPQVGGRGRVRGVTGRRADGLWSLLRSRWFVTLDTHLLCRSRVEAAWPTISPFDAFSLPPVCGCLRHGLLRVSIERQSLYFVGFAYRQCMVACV